MGPDPPKLPPKPPIFGGFPGGVMGGVPRTPQDPRNMGTFGLSIRGGAGRPPGEDGGGERGATMPTTSGIQSGDRRNTVTSTNTTTNTNRCARVPTPTRTPNELTSTNTTAKKKKNIRANKKKYPCTQKIFRSNKKNIR